jgi:alginate O-acetyltransferase complex protein AlgI
VVFTFYIVCFAWIFFRSANLDEAAHIITNMYSGGAHQNIFEMISLVQLFILVLCAGIITVKRFSERKHPKKLLWMNQANSSLRRVVYACVINFIIFFGVTGKAVFIYFQF